MHLLNAQRSTSASPIPFESFPQHRLTDMPLSEHERTEELNPRGPQPVFDGRLVVGPVTSPRLAIPSLADAAEGK